MNDLVPHTGTLLAQIERLVRSDIDPARLEAMLSLYNRERDRSQLEAFNRAMTALQADVFEVAATGKNPTFKTAYPTLHDLLREARPYYTNHGFGIRFGSSLQKTEAPAPQPGWQRVVIIISHDEGHWEEAYLDGPPDASNRSRTPVQGIGSTVTYLRRYLFQMVLNLVPGGDPTDRTDDDGRGGVDSPVTPEQVVEIQKAMREVNLTDEETSRFLKAFEVADVRDIPARRYVIALNSIASAPSRRSEKQEEKKDDDSAPV